MQIPLSRKLSTYHQEADDGEREVHTNPITLLAFATMTPYHSSGRSTSKEHPTKDQADVDRRLQIPLLQTIISPRHVENSSGSLTQPQYHYNTPQEPPDRFCVVRVDGHIPSASCEIFLGSEQLVYSSVGLGWLRSFLFIV